MVFRPILVPDSTGIGSPMARDLRSRSFGPATAKYRELGTLTDLLAFNAISALPTRNFQAASFEGAARLTDESSSAAPSTAPATAPADSDLRAKRRCVLLIAYLSFDGSLFEYSFR